MLEFLIPLVGFGFFIFVFLIVLAAGAAWIYTLVDAVQRDFDGENDKLLWVLVLLFAGVLGSIIYYFVVMRDDDEDDESNGE
jgi:heme/copper-type cytochrome/quinol oxidase subunit 2